MANYILRRLLYAVPIIIGVNIITAFLFFYLNSPDQMARTILGERNITPEMVENWKKEKGYDKPLFINTKEKGLSKITQTIFFEKNIPLFWFDFGKSDRNNINITTEIKKRMTPSFLIALPTMILGLIVTLTISMIVAWLRATYIDIWGVIAAITMMSVSTLFYIIGGQFLMGKIFKLFPISGYGEGMSAVKFLILPVIIGIVSGIGEGVRFYRTVFLEEINKDYVRTARAKGLKEKDVLFKHTLKNAMIPILTNVVIAIPFLFYGSLIMEAFFAIPGLGSFTLEAIYAQDFAIVRAMVYLGSILYIVGLILTDISYTIFDPRIRLK